MESFPLYLLRIPEWKIVFSNKDIGHSEFWEKIVSHIVAEHFHVPQKTIVNLPYCQRRARIVGSKVYYGGKLDPELLKLICQVIGNPSLVFCYDYHEKRLKEDVRQFKIIIGKLI